MFLPLCGFGAKPAALCAAGIAVRAAIAAEQRDNRGVSDPHFAAPFFAPHPVPRGSLTSQMLITVVRAEPPSSVNIATCVATS